MANIIIIAFRILSTNSQTIYVLKANMQLKAVFIQNLKKYRKRWGISQMELAELCDTSTSYIGQIEIGNRFPSLEMIERFAKALQIKPYLLFFDEEDPVTAGTDVLSDSAKGELIKRLTAAIRRVVSQID